MTPDTESFLTPLGLRWMRGTDDPFGKVEWGLLAIGSAVCVGVCLGVARLFGVPHEPGFNGSLLSGYSPVMSILAVAVATAVAVIPAVAFGVFVGVEGALFCLAVGVAGLAGECGSVRSVLQYSPDGHPLIVMAIETVILTAIVHAGWLVVAWGSAALRQRSGVEKTVADPVDASPWMGVLVQIAVTGVCAMVLIQTDRTSQAIGGLSVAVIVGVAGAYLSSDITAGVWYWFTPAAVGVIGYALAWSGGARTPTGDLQGWGAALARPTPLDYAAVGVAAAVFGRWVGRRWSQEDEPAEIVEKPAVLSKPVPVTGPPPPAPSMQ
jgi:hypothetical protein